jgi:ABC-type branched-subunit amino acid transport system ATPase component
MPLLEARQLTMQFGGLTAVKQVNLSLEKGNDCQPDWSERCGEDHVF